MQNRTQGSTLLFKLPTFQPQQPECGTVAMRRLNSNLSLQLVFLSFSDGCRDWGRVGLKLKKREVNVYSYN